MQEQERVLTILIVLAAVVLNFSIVRHSFVGWVAKRSNIMKGQSIAERAAYFHMFSRLELILPAPEPTDFSASRAPLARGAECVIRMAVLVCCISMLQACNDNLTPNNATNTQKSPHLKSPEQFNFERYTKNSSKRLVEHTDSFGYRSLGPQNGFTGDEID